MFARTLRHAVTPLELEKLEPRTLLSALHHGGLIRSIEFDQAPAAVQTGLDTLAGTTVATTQTVYLGNVRGIETYTIDISSTGTNSVYTVDQKGNPVTAPAHSTTTLGAISNAAVTAEITAIATALNATAPDPAATVKVLTAADNSATYSIALSITKASGRTCRVLITVDSNGNPTGNQSLPLSVFSAAIQNGLTSNAPAGSTPLTSTSPVRVRTLNGITTYSAVYRYTGVTTTVSVDNTGALTNLPSTSKAQFSTIPAAAQAQLQTLANINGFVGTIDPAANVKVYDEANGTVIYAVRLPVTGTGKSGATYTYMIAVASDQAGNPTVPPHDGFGGWGWCGGWWWGGFRGGQFGGSHHGGEGEGNSNDDHDDHDNNNGNENDNEDNGGKADTSVSSGSTTVPASFTGFSRFTRKLGFHF